MDDISEQEAVHKAKEALDFPETSAYRVWRVHSLDREADDYYLVQLDTEKGKSAVAMVDIRSGAVNISAQLPHSEAHLTVDALTAKNWRELTNDPRQIWSGCPVRFRDRLSTLFGRSRCPMVLSGM